MCNLYVRITYELRGYPAYHPSSPPPPTIQNMHFIQRDSRHSMTPRITDKKLVLFEMFEKEEENKIPQAILSDFTPVPQTKKKKPFPHLSLSLTRYLIPLLLLLHIHRHELPLVPKQNIHIHICAYIYISQLSRNILALTLMP